MNPNVVGTSESLLQLQKTQNQLSIAQRQLPSANQMISQAENAYKKLASYRAVLDVAKPDEL